MSYQVAFTYCGIPGTVEVTNGQPVWVSWGQASCEIGAAIGGLRNAINRAMANDLGRAVAR